MNPYEVLGVSEGADEETIKKAYKELVKKYHPDKYVNNPLADLAAEKMKEINKAYDMLTKNNGAAHNTSGSYGSSGHGTYGGYRNAGAYQNIKPTFELVRQLIGMNAVTQALMMLNQLPKTAEWYFLSGVANIRRGWNSVGVEHLEKAVEMEPGNAEYRDTLNRVKDNVNTYNSGGTTFTGGGSICRALPCFCLPCFCPGSCCCC